MAGERTTRAECRAEADNALLWMRAAIFLFVVTGGLAWLFTLASGTPRANWTAAAGARSAPSSRGFAPLSPPSVRPWLMVSAMGRLGRIILTEAAALDPDEYTHGSLGNSEGDWRKLTAEEAEVFGILRDDYPLLHTTLVAWESFQTIIGGGNWHRNFDAPAGARVRRGQAIRNACAERPDSTEAPDTPIAFAAFAKAAIGLPVADAWAVWMKHNAWLMRQRYVPFDRYRAGDLCRPPLSAGKALSRVFSGSTRV